MGTPASARQKRNAEASTPARSSMRELGSVLPPDLEAFLGAWEAEKLLAERRLKDVRKLQAVAAHMRADAEGDLQQVTYLVEQGHVFLSAWEDLRRRAEREGILIQERDLALRAAETARAEIRRLTEARLLTPAAADGDRGQQQGLEQVMPSLPRHSEEGTGTTSRARTQVTVAVPAPVPAPAIDPQVLQMWLAWWAGTMAMASLGGLPPPVSPSMPAGAREGPPPPLVTLAPQSVFEGAAAPEGQGGPVETPISLRTPAARAPRKGLSEAPMTGHSKLAFAGEGEAQTHREGTGRAPFSVRDAEGTPRRALAGTRARGAQGQVDTKERDGFPLEPSLDEVAAVAPREKDAGEATILSPLHRAVDAPLTSLRRRASTLLSEHDEEGPAPRERAGRGVGASVGTSRGPTGDDVDRGLGPRRELEDSGSDPPSSVS
ncbi:hypothetical protein Emag_001079 [Eimeria magna]